MSSNDDTRYFCENTSVVPNAFTGDVIQNDEFLSFTKMVGGSIGIAFDDFFLERLMSDALCTIAHSACGSDSVFCVDVRDSDGPGMPVIESSTPSSIGDDIDWKLLIRRLDDAIDNSPSVIEPNAESCDGLLLLHIFMPRIEYSMRRLFEFFNVHESVVN